MIGARNTLCTSFALLIPVLVWHYYKKRSRRIVHPPSPSSLPLIGNLLSLPSGPEHIVYMKLGKDLHSDIIYLDLLGHDIVVLNSPQAAVELLDKRSSIYSDRFCPLMFKDKSLLDWSTSPPFLGYNDVWRHHRRMMNKWLNIREVSQFYKMQESHARSLLQRLLVVSAAAEAHPFDSVKDEFYFAMGSSIFQMAYGYKAQEITDPYLRAAHELDDHAAQAAMLTRFYVNVFPLLNRVPEWVPGTDWKRTVRMWREEKIYALNAPFQWTQNQVAQGTGETSIVGDLLRDDNLMLGLIPEERDGRLKELAHILYSGGTDTTSSLLLSFVASMVLNPEVQAQAQNEIDLTLGLGVLPTMADRERLPYVNRLILELMRWRPPLTIGIPHQCFQDDVYRGYTITKGTIVIGNIWSMSRDEKVYRDPETFNPDRFLDPEVPPVPVFGWGRRKCPGIYFGEASLFITVSSLLAAFTFSKKKDPNGNYIEPTIEDSPDSIVLGLKPFEFDFTPRSDMHRVIDEAME
ncbi:cytochrome P450 family protein [Rhizoctonia solani 123E]|uniref:Cytochrome P450 family protein n=1 Tax=Rhizoctonia solani 123E TaxID=1423351 RepID=A0A074RYT1_9AGAM|nr:cytochrome P450 family protein [Rhizoctonia solani 123E]